MTDDELLDELRKLCERMGENEPGAHDDFHAELVEHGARLVEIAYEYRMKFRALHRAHKEVRHD